MAELRPIPFEHLLRRVLDEPARQGSIFDLPLTKAWRPDPRVDLSVAIHGERAQTPVGPAAGPHAQMAQNVVLAWLAGSRVIELKTVQVLDQLKIPRPCIDAATIGFNVEWSQEMRLEESLREYVAGWMLIDILRHLDPLGLGPDAAQAAAPIFELSVGYDLKGLQSPQMRNYLERVRDVSPILDELRAAMPRGHSRLRELDYRREMVSCVTLSTFHGCPPGEIEAIARYLLHEIGVDVIVKLNPTLLGYEEVCYLLGERMGYHELHPNRPAFESDLGWNDAIAMAKRLDDDARRVGRTFGVKMTNTLVVENHKTFFAAEEMYLSGPPLHVLAMHCVERWRAALGTTIPISFSGGIDQHNFADAVACDLVPVTTCTDLLRPGGYARLPRYLRNLEEAMLDAGAPDRDEFLLRRFGQGPEAVRGVFAQEREQRERLSSLGDEGARAAEALLIELEEALLLAAKTRPDGNSTTLARTLDAFGERRLDPRRSADVPEPARALVATRAPQLLDEIVRTAGLLNTHEAVVRVTGDPRYAAGKNSKPPRKVGTKLVLLDCLSCDKCVPVCPNNANFEITTPQEEVVYDDIVVDAAGFVARMPRVGTWKVAKPSQWANYADACNECGNCDVFCPEDGGPYIMKARFFGSRASLEASPGLDGMVVEQEGDRLLVTARLASRRYRLELPHAGGTAALDDGVVSIVYDVATAAVREVGPSQHPDIGRDSAGEHHRVSGAVFLTLRALVRGALDGKRLNPVSAAVGGARFPG